MDMGLSRGRNLKAIWQDLVDNYGFAGSYQNYLIEVDAFNTHLLQMM